MGLTTWKNAPDGRVIKSDVTIAKNYLSEKEVESLNRLSNAFIDIAEQNAEGHILMTMADWSILLQKYMDLNNRPMLLDTGQVTHEQAIEKEQGSDAIHDTVHEMAKDEARHCAGFAGLYKRYFK